MRVYTIAAVCTFPYRKVKIVTRMSQPCSNAGGNKHLSLVTLLPANANWNPLLLLMRGKSCVKTQGCATKLVSWWFLFQCSYLCGYPKLHQHIHSYIWLSDKPQYTCEFRIIGGCGDVLYFFFFKKVGGGLVAEGTQVCVSMVNDIHY